MKETSKLSSKSDQMKAFLYIGCYKNNEFRCILMPFSYIACGGSVLQVSEAAREREEKSEGIEKIGGQSVLPQFISSVSSPQSFTPSHCQNRGLQNPFLHWIMVESHSEIKNHPHSIKHSVHLSWNSHSKGKCAIVCLNKDNIHWTLTAVPLIAAVTTIIPAVAAHGWIYTAFIVALEQLRAGWEIQKLNSLSNVHIETTLQNRNSTITSISHFFPTQARLLIKWSKMWPISFFY